MWAISAKTPPMPHDLRPLLPPEQKDYQGHGFFLPDFYEPQDMPPGGLPKTIMRAGNSADRTDAHRPSAPHPASLAGGNP